MIKYGTYTTYLCVNCESETTVPLGVNPNDELEKTSSHCKEHKWVKGEN